MFRLLLLLVLTTTTARAAGTDERRRNLDHLVQAWEGEAGRPEEKALEAALREAEALGAWGSAARLHLWQAQRLLEQGDERGALQRLVRGLAAADRPAAGDGAEAMEAGVEARLVGAELLDEMGRGDDASALAEEGVLRAVQLGWSGGVAQASRAVLTRALREEHIGEPGAFARVVVRLDGILGAWDEYRRSPAGRPGALGVLLADLAERLLSAPLPGEAAATFALALRVDALDGRTDHPDDWVRLAWACLLDGQEELAAWAVSQAAAPGSQERAPWATELSLRVRVHGLARSQRWDEALELIGEGGTAWSRSLRADLLLLAGRGRDAAALHAELAAGLPAELGGEEWIEAAVAAAGAGDLGSARAALARVEDMEPASAGPGTWVRLAWARAWVAAREGRAGDARAALATAGPMLLGALLVDDLAALGVEYARLARVAGDPEGEAAALRHGAQWEQELGLGTSGHRAALARAAGAARSGDTGALRLWIEGMERLLLWRASLGPEAGGTGRPPLWAPPEEEGASVLLGQSVRGRRPGDALRVVRAQAAARVWAALPTDDAVRRRLLGDAGPWLDAFSREREDAVRTALRGADGTSTPPSVQDPIPRLREVTLAARGQPDRRLLALSDLRSPPRLPRGPVAAILVDLPEVAGTTILLTRQGSRFVPAPQACAALQHAAGRGLAVVVAPLVCPAPAISQPNLALLLAMLAEPRDAPPATGRAPGPTLPPLDALALGLPADDGPNGRRALLLGAPPAGGSEDSLPALLAGAPPPWRRRAP